MATLPLKLLTTLMHFFTCFIYDELNLEYDRSAGNLYMYKPGDRLVLHVKLPVDHEIFEN